MFHKCHQYCESAGACTSCSSSTILSERVVFHTVISRKVCNVSRCSRMTDYLSLVAFSLLVQRNSTAVLHLRNAYATSAIWAPADAPSTRSASVRYRNICHSPFVPGAPSDSLSLALSCSVIVALHTAEYTDVVNVIAW